jgi:phospholipid transport system transporter-binding protein
MLLLPEQLTLRNAQQVLSELQAQIKAAGTNEIRLDASAMRQMDSAALAVLLACRRAADAGRQRFTVCNPPTRLVDFAHLYGVQELLQLELVPA